VHIQLIQSYAHMLICQPPMDEDTNFCMLAQYLHCGFPQYVLFARSYSPSTPTIPAPRTQIVVYGAPPSSQMPHSRPQPGVNFAPQN
jgi:hypothetical protein